MDIKRSSLQYSFHITVVQWYIPRFLLLLDLATRITLAELTLDTDNNTITFCYRWNDIKGYQASPLTHTTDQHTSFNHNRQATRSSLKKQNFQTMYSRSTLLAVLAIFTLFLSTSYAAKVPAEAEGTEIKEVKKGDSKSDRSLKVSDRAAADAMDIGTSEKVPGSTYKGALILCEGPTPISQFFTTRTSSVFLYPVWSTGCVSRYVLGNGKINHAQLWGGQFTGLDYFYERIITCTTGRVCLQARQGVYTRTLYCCLPTWEAHVVTFGI